MALPSTLFALALLLVSGVLMLWHAATLRRSECEEAMVEDEAESRFAWRQFRRRMQASGMIGLLGLGIFVGQFIQAPLLWVFFWGAMVVLLLWIVLLALADALATHHHFRRLRARQLAEHARDHAELRRRLNP